MCFRAAKPRTRAWFPPRGSLAAKSRYAGSVGTRLYVPWLDELLVDPRLRPDELALVRDDGTRRVFRVDLEAGTVELVRDDQAPASRKAMVGRRWRLASSFWSPRSSERFRTGRWETACEAPGIGCRRGPEVPFRVPPLVDVASGALPRAFRRAFAWSRIPPCSTCARSATRGLHGNAPGAFGAGRGPLSGGAPPSSWVADDW